MMDVEEIGNLMRYRGGVHYWGEYFIVFFPHVSEHIDHYKSIKKITYADFQPNLVRTRV